MTQRRWLLLACLFPLIGFWTYGLFDLDEGFYGAVVADMIRRHDWITPTLNGAPWFEKPILSYWLAIPFVQLFGNEFGARLPSALCTLATAWTWHWFARKHAPQVQFLLPLAYSGSLLATGIGRMMMTDAVFVLCLTLAFIWMFEHFTGEKTLWASGLALGFALLAKGPVAMILVAAVLALLVFWARADRDTALKFGWAFVIALAVACIWYVPCYLVNGKLFVEEFLIKQNIGRFAGGDTAHSTPLWTAPIYYPLILWLALLPLSAFALRELIQSFRTEAKRRELTLESFLWSWSGVVLVLFSMSGTKLPHYILPAVGPFAALLAFALRDRADKFVGTAAMWCASIGCLSMLVFCAIDRTQFADVRRVALTAKTSTKHVGTFELSGVHPAGTGGPLTEQSSPSIGFYLRRPFREFSSPTELSESGFQGLLITRKGRIGAEAVLSLALNGSTVHQIEPTGLSYELWEVRPDLTLRR